MNNITEVFDKACQAIISPRQYRYNIHSISPKQIVFKQKIVERVDFQVRNDEGLNISAMILKQKNKQPKETILYFHGNGGNKTQILNVIPLLGEMDMGVIAFDFIGCGNSDGGYLTYGVNESKDAETVLREAYKYINISKLTVWGRSMGAVTAIIFAERNHKIVEKLVLDSPFPKLENVIKRVIQKQTKFPQTIINIVFYFLRKEIQGKLKFALFSEDYLAKIKKLNKNLSILLLFSENDQVVTKNDVFDFYHMIKFEKEILEITQSHEEDRSLIVLKEVVRWIQKQKIKKPLRLKLYREFMIVEQEEVYTIC